MDSTLFCGQTPIGQSAEPVLRDGRLSSGGIGPVLLVKELQGSIDQTWLEVAFRILSLWGVVSFLLWLCGSCFSRLVFKLFSLYCESPNSGDQPCHRPMLNLIHRGKTMYFLNEKIASGW